MSISNLQVSSQTPYDIKCNTMTCDDINASEHSCNNMNCQNMNCTSIITDTFQVNNPTYNFLEGSSTGGQTLTNGSVTALTFWQVSNVLGDAIVKANDIDPLDNDYDFIVQEDGIYSVETTVTFSPNPSGERVLIIYLQGSNKGHELDSATAPNAKRMHVSARDYMEAGDRIRIAGFQNSGGNLSIGTSAGLNRLTIFKQ